MENVLTSDVFFFVTTIAIALVSLVAVIALIYVILILRDIHNISHRVREEAQSLTSDIDELRNTIKSKKALLGPIFYFVVKAIKRNMKSRKNADGGADDE